MIGQIEGEFWVVIKMLDFNNQHPPWANEDSERKREELQKVSEDVIASLAQKSQKRKPER